jgi:hypothetical protein
MTHLFWLQPMAAPEIRPSIIHPTLAVYQLKTETKREALAVCSNPSQTYIYDTHSNKNVHVSALFVYVRRATLVVVFLGHRVIGVEALGNNGTASIPSILCAAFWHVLWYPANVQQEID